jgi:hypothetical protein
MRTRTLLVLATTLTVVTIAASGVALGSGVGGVVGGAAAPDPARPVAAHPTADPQTGVGRASAVLRSWDGRRAAAWSHADPGALSGLYTSGSRTGRRDARDLRRWCRRGLRVVGVRQQVAEIRVAVETSRRLVLVVSDRTVDAVAVGHHRRTALPASAWTTHRIRLRQTHGRWLVEDAWIQAQPAR